VAEKLGKERYAKTIEKFGFGQPTGIDLPGEASGAVRRPEKWATIDLATHAYGQGIAVTPIQLVMAYGAVANGGFLMRPFVVKRAVGADGRVLWENQPHVVRRVVSEATASTLTSILKGVVDEGGTGVLASVDGFEVAGKTGTAQKAEHGVYTRKRVASFVGFVPADQPRLVMAVILDEPETSVTAARSPRRLFATSPPRRCSASPSFPIKRRRSRRRRCSRKPP
jgi:cell division protein FtsI (penicillin-binding protein 3)